MNKVNLLTRLIVLNLLAVLVYSCGGSSELEKKKAELDEKRKELMELQSQISDLEKQVAELDTATGDATGTILVSSYNVEAKPFVHKVEVRGSVASRKNVLMSAETMGRIERINVSEGQAVRKGDLLLQIDSDIIANNVSEVETQIELAKTVYERQENLWKQNIGTEIQYLQAKNNYESLERRLATLKSQLSQYYVKAPFSGIVDEIPVKIGEMAQPGLPLVRIVNPDEMYVAADVSEAFLGKFEAGQEVEVIFPVQNVTLKSKIISVGNVINDQNRTFKIEVALPSKKDFKFRPNQVAMLSLVDYLKKDALSVPTNVIQSDAGGKFVYTIGMKDGKRVAQKVAVQTGKSFENMTEIVAGLSNGANVINQGFRNVTNGAEISVSSASL
ncbi:MAG: efflux RND transporter periplasmic adaptor subunit [Cyclobacteriaceae bacterium]|nr:efflux RND transporter periplasmic adaptor subunit [Cyclobacteriaceae bacterium SS2]